MEKCQSHKNANADCLAREASLPVIDSAGESLFIQERINTPTWLNLQKTSSSSWRWVNDSSMDYYTKWLPGQPVSLPDHSCAVVENRGIVSGWRVENCTACRNTLCKKGI